jgi:hypothetical protein
VLEDFLWVTVTPRACEESTLLFIEESVIPLKVNSQNRTKSIYVGTVGDA